MVLLARAGYLPLLVSQKGKMCLLRLTVIEFKNWKGHERSDAAAIVSFPQFGKNAKNYSK